MRAIESPDTGRQATEKLYSIDAMIANHLESLTFAFDDGAEEGRCGGSPLRFTSEIAGSRIAEQCEITGKSRDNTLDAETGDSAFDGVE